MAQQDPNLRSAVDEILSTGDDARLSFLTEMIRKRKLSTAMMALNDILRDGTPSQKEQARAAVERLGFVAD